MANGFYEIIEAKEIVTAGLVSKQQVRISFSTRDDNSYLPPENANYATGSWAHDIYTGNVYAYDESAATGSKWDLQICLKSS